MRKAGKVAAVAFASALLLAPGPDSGARAAGSPWSPTGEVFRYGQTGAEFRVLRDAGTGRKVLEAAGGRRFDSVEDAVRAEEATLSPLRRALAPDLWAAAEDPDRAAEPVKVIVVLRSQPVHDVSRAIREQVRERLAPKFATLREILSGIASRRERDDGGRLQIGHRIEEEKRLLSAEDRETLSRIRQEVKDRVHAMRTEILAAARPRAGEEQDAVASRITAIPGATVRSRSLVLSAVAATVPAGRLRDVVEGIPGVACVYADLDAPPILDRSIPNMGAKTWWNAGYDGGTGVGVGNFDTGVDDSHPALSGHVVAKDFVDAGSPDDTSGHGTHIAGIMGSRDTTYRGVAPGCTVFNGKSGYWYISTAAMMQGGDWAADNGCDIFSNSVGGYGNSTGNSSHALYNDAASAEIGVSVSAAAANYGFTEDGLAPNSTGFNGFCVSGYSPGYPDRSGNLFWDGSSHGPCSDGRRKPDIAAPFIANSCNNTWEGDGSDFVQMGGTSMAAPHVAGALALLYDYGASWTPEGMKALLLASTWNQSPTPTSWDYGWGWGAIDVDAAYVNRPGVHEGSFTSSGSTVAWLRGPALAAGEKVALCWNRHVTWNNADVPTSYKSIVDLDLEVWGTDGSLVGTSARTLDSVERVLAASAVSGTYIKVTRSGSFPSGQTAVDWAVASGGGSSLSTTSAPSPPSVSIALAAGSGTVFTGDTVTLEAALTNSGGIGATTPAVTLSIPTGFTLESGANPQTIPSVAAGGGTSKATWILRADPGPSGTKSFAAQGSFTSFGSSTTTSSAGTSVEVVSLPAATLSLEDDAPFATSTTVAARIRLVFAERTITEMQVRNGGGEFGGWAPYAPSFDWDLGPGTGNRTVEARIRDVAGIESAIFGDSLYCDPEAPTGSFVLSGSREYLMPWEDLVAETTSDDAGGSGVEAFRLRWGAERPWTDWLPLAGGPGIALSRPFGEAVAAEGEFRDFAGNLSAASTAAIRLVPADATDLTAAKSFKGTLLPGGAGGSFRMGALAGEEISVRVRAKRVDLAVDLWNPAGEKAAEGRFPEDARKPGIDGYRVATAGVHWLVVRPAGEVPADGLPFELKVSVNRKRVSLGWASGAAPTDGLARIPFDGVEGMIFTATIWQAAGGGVLVGPDGSSVPVPMENAGTGMFRILPIVLSGGSGTYRLDVPSASYVSYDLRLKPPRRVSLPLKVKGGR